jgi:serine phosphatase RsbU (regulator of sigma subunit)
LSVPDWIPCTGFAGLFAYSNDADGSASAQVSTRSALALGDPLQGSGARAHLLVRGTAFPDAAQPGYAVIVDLPVSEDVKQRLRGETGVEVRSVRTVNDQARGGVPPKPLQGRVNPSAESGRTGTSNGLMPSGSLIEYHDWTSGLSGTLLVSTQLSISELYDRISASQSGGGLSIGQIMLVLLYAIGGLFFVIEVVALIMGLALAKSITGSVHALFAGTERVRQGDFTHKIAVKSEDQLGELAGSFNSMTASIEELLRQAAEKKRLEEELRIAHEIQMSLLPQGPLEMPGLSVTALCVPAREVGGDYYDFLPLDDHRVGVLIADVSGKGTSAALYMAELKGLVLSLSQIHTSPRQLLISANRIIAEHLDARSFITMTYAVIDLRAHMMTYARAGHTPLIYLPGPGIDSRRVRILAPDGLVLGLKIDKGEMFERLLEEETLPLRSGDLYLFFTDGITEAMNKNDDCFGENRLGRLIEAHPDLTSNELRERVLREIQAFVGDAPQHDDMTMIVLKVDEIGARVLAATAAEPAGVAK